MHVGGVEMPSQPCKHCLQATDQTGHASLMRKAGFSLKTSAVERVSLQNGTLCCLEDG